MEPFVYELPRERIAQRPVYPYDSAKLLVVDQGNGGLYAERGHVRRSFTLLTSRNVVFNDSAVLPARLFGVLESGAEAELLVLRHEGDNVWRCMGRPLRRFRPGSRIVCRNPAANEELVATVLERVERPTQRGAAGLQIAELLPAIGVMPIPPYIRDGRSDERDRVDCRTHSPDPRLCCRTDGEPALYPRTSRAHLGTQPGAPASDAARRARRVL